ncbi:MAG: hypothetical protein Q8Q73_10355, partial [Stagnimonas sp.]|nr:hypothetical protein [Stagnimonas sp.]
RSDTAFSTGDENPFNQRGNLFNGVTVDRVVLNPAYDPEGPMDASNPQFVNVPGTRNGVPASNDFNLVLLRADIRGDWKLSDNLNLTGRLRAVLDPTVYEEFDPDAVGSQAVGRNYGRPHYFRYDAEGRSRSNPLEWTSREGMIDLPSLYASYNRGPLLVKFGNQEIAWGQAIFFRVLDVPNGLDLRRHAVLDYATEEFQDKRVPSIALRSSYQFEGGWLADGYVQRFQPTVLGNPNTQYNLIPSQFTVHDRYARFDDKLNFGLRLKGDLGKFGVQAIAARRYNPDGVYRWTQSGVNRDLPGAPGSGAVLAQTAFEVDPTGVWSADEWYTYAAMARLNGTTGLNTAVAEFPAAALLGAFEAPNKTVAEIELNTFFIGSGSGLRGHIERTYRRETNLGLGASYITEGDPGSWLDQLIINVEALYTPDRSFTNPSLSQKFLKQEEFTTALVMEKYQSLVKSLPATYLVAQWLFKTRSDLLGRSLEGMGGDVDNTPGGKPNYNAFAFALQQPFPNLIWRADLAVLYEPSGGILVQPGLRWKPNGAVTVEAFYNYLNGGLNGNPNSNAISSLGYADELTLRLGYQF